MAFSGFPVSGLCRGSGGVATHRSTKEGCIFCLQLEASCLQLSFFTYMCFGAFWLTIGAFLLTVEASPSLLTVEASLLAVGSASY